MKAIVLREYGPPEVLGLQEVEKPVPRDNEVRIRVRATTVNYGDLTARNFRYIATRRFNMPMLLYYPARLAFGFFKPRIRILGSEFAGDIDAVGKDVTLFGQGDVVFGYSGMRMGAYAEYLCLPENGVLAKKPANMSYEQAAVVPYGAIVALNLLRKMRIQKGHRVLVNGASGAIGSHAVQLAKYWGADVTGVCSTPRLGFVKTIGADKVVDYTKEDFTNSGETYDLIFDILGRSSFSRVKRALKPGGRYLLASFKMKQLFEMLGTKITGGRQVVCAMSGEKAEDLHLINEIIEAGRIIAPIDKCFVLEKASEAHGYVEDGLKKGHVVLTLV